MPNQIPDDLKNMYVWAMSNSEKEPLDLFKVLYTQDTTLSSAYNHNSKLYPYSSIEILYNKYPNLPTRPAIRATSDTNYAFIDIEKTSDFANNPYLRLPFVYLERSMHGGFHGIVPFKQPHLKHIVVIKDTTYDTEVILNRHFITLTNDVCDLPSDPISESQSNDFLLNRIHQFTKQKAKVINGRQLIDNETIINKAISVFEQADIMQIDCEPLRINNNDDKSHVEFKYLIKYGFKLHNGSFKNYNFKEFLPILHAFAKLKVPHRDKHDGIRRIPEIGEVTYLEFVVFNVCEYIFKNP